MCLQEYRSINPSDSQIEESWHGIEQQSDSHSVGRDGHTSLPSETVNSGSKDEPPDVRLLNARLDVSSCSGHSLGFGTIALCQGPRTLKETHTVAAD